MEMDRKGMQHREWERTEEERKGFCATPDY
jgi:hypothetical protein